MRLGLAVCGAHDRQLGLPRAHRDVIQNFLREILWIPRLVTCCRRLADGDVYPCGAASAEAALVLLLLPQRLLLPMSVRH